MALEIWFTFVIAAGILLVIPGPTILTVISYSVAHGRGAKVPLVAAVALGDSTALAVSLLGLGALLAASAFWFTVVKLVGGLYLLFLNTYLVTALNPKGIVFFVAFLPQFLSPNANVTQQLWIFAATFVCLATINATVYAIFAASARKLLASPRAQRRFNVAGGCLLSTAGVWALLAKRPA